MVTIMIRYILLQRPDDGSVCVVMVKSIYSLGPRGIVQLVNFVCSRFVRIVTAELRFFRNYRIDESYHYLFTLHNIQPSGYYHRMGFIMLHHIARLVIH